MRRYLAQRGIFCSFCRVPGIFKRNPMTAAGILRQAYDMTIGVVVSGTSGGCKREFWGKWL